MQATIKLVAVAAVLMATQASAQSNLGAIPAHIAITNAKEEARSDDDTLMLVWTDADIRPMGRGWCVTLNGVHRTRGTLVRIPVFVEQDGRAWRNDGVGKAKYDGGADGLYMPPRVAAGCTPQASAN